MFFNVARDNQSGGDRDKGGSGDDEKNNNWDKLREKVRPRLDNEKQPDTFIVYFCGENHKEPRYKNNLIANIEYNEQGVDYYLLVEGLFYGEESNSHMQGIEYPPAKWLGCLLSLHLYITQLKGIFLFEIPSDDSMFTWDDDETKIKVAEFLTKLRFFFQTHDVKDSYPCHFLALLNQHKPELMKTADYCITRWKLSSTIDRKEVQSSWLYEQDLKYFKDNFNSFLGLTVHIMEYLSNDQQIRGVLTSCGNGILDLDNECIPSIKDISNEYTHDYYNTQLEIYRKAVGLSCVVREIFILNNLKHFLENKCPRKNVIVILGDAHVGNIENNITNFLGNSLTVQDLTYSFSFWPLTRQEKEGNPIEIKFPSYECGIN